MEQPDPKDLLVITKQDYAEIQRVITEQYATQQQLERRIAELEAQLGQRTPFQPVVQVATANRVGDVVAPQPLAQAVAAHTDACPWCGAAPVGLRPHTNPKLAGRGVQQLHFACGRHRLRINPT